MVPKAFKISNNEVVGSGGSRVDEMFKNLLELKKLKNNKFEILTNIGTMGKPIFLTLGTGKAFNL